MFWDAVLGSLTILTNWQIYVAAVEYLAIFMVPMVVAGFLMTSENGEDGSMFVGCLSMLALPILQVAAIAVFILTTSPIILGLGSEAAWSLPWAVLFSAPWAFAKLVGILLVAAFGLAFIPVLGQLQSLKTLVLGGIGLVFVLNILDAFYAGAVKAQVDILPGFWFVVGLLVVGGIMAGIGMMVATLLGGLLGMASEGIGVLVMFPIASVFGFIPVFIYGAWLGAQLSGIAS